MDFGFLTNVFTWFASNEFGTALGAVTLLVTAGAALATVIPGTSENRIIKAVASVVNWVGLNFANAANNPELKKQLEDMTKKADALEKVVEASTKKK